VANEHVQIPVQQSVLNAQRPLTARQRADRHVPFSQMPEQQSVSTAQPTLTARQDADRHVPFSQLLVQH